MEVVTVVTEGVTDTVVVRRICSEVGLDIAAVHGENGKNRLDRSLAGYNQAARRERWLVLRDLDTDADCAPTLVRKLLPEPSRGMMLRIATRAIESWLLADAPAFASCAIRGPARCGKTSCRGTTAGPRSVRATPVA